MKIGAEKGRPVEDIQADIKRLQTELTQRQEEQTQEEEADGDEPKRRSRFEEIALEELKSQNHIERVIPIIIYRQKTYGKSDSGADAPVIGINTLQNLGIPHLEIQPCDTTIRLADNTTPTVLGTTELLSSIKHQRQETTVIVVAFDIPLIIDYGLMKAYGMLLDQETDIVIMKETGKEICFPARNTYQACQLNEITAEDIQETISQPENLTEENRLQLKTILQKHKTVFGTTGVAEVAPIEIKTYQIRNEHM